MTIRIPRISRKLLWPVAAVIVVGAAWASSGYWSPLLQRWTADEQAGQEAGTAEGDHEHGHDDADSLELSKQARANIGLKTGPVELTTYDRTIMIPAMVVERPGRTHLQVPASLTGVVTGVYAVRGEMVESRQVLFRLRLTHEDLVRAQTEFLRTLGQLDVENKEIARLEKVTERGVVAGKLLLERQYEKEKLEAALAAYRESLRLHGLSEQQVAQIQQRRKLLRQLEITVPALHDDASLHDDAEEPIRRAAAGSASRWRLPIGTHTVADESGSPGETDASGSLRSSPATRPSGGLTLSASLQSRTADPESHATYKGRFVVQDLNVQKGQAVAAGDPLCLLTDLSELYIEGRAFEQDADRLAEAARNGWTVTAHFENRSGKPEEVPGLEIVYLSNQVDPDTRAFSFYVALPNRTVREVTSGRHRFVTWKYKPGQRVNLQVPAEKWREQIVLPVEAVVDEGAESFVFQQNGDRFERRPVHVKYRDQHKAVIANDGSLFPGDVVALSGAHQMQMALKQKAGGGGGHSHGHGHMH